MWRFDEPLGCLGWQLVVKFCLEGPQGPNMRAEGQSIWRSEFNAKVKQDATINFDENTLKIERIYVISCGWFR